MSGVVSGDPVRLRVFGGEVRRCLGPVAGSVGEYRAARAAFSSAPNELGGAVVADVSLRLEDRCDELARLGALVDEFAEGLCALDRSGAGGAVTVSWAQLRAGLSAGARATWSALEGALEVETGASTGVHLSRAAVHGSRWVNATQRLYFLNREYYTPRGFIPDARVYQRSVAADRAALAPRMERLSGHRSGVRAALSRSEPITRVGRWIDSAPSGAGRALRWGGRALGFVGAAYSVVEGYESYQRGDVEGVAVNAAYAAGGVMMLFPLTAPAGAVVVAGALLWENREHIAAAGRWVGERIDGAARSAAATLASAGEGALRLVGGLLGS